MDDSQNPIIEIDVEHEQARPVDTPAGVPVTKPVNIEIAQLKHAVFGSIIRVQFSRSIDHLDMTVESAGALMQQIKTVVRSILAETSSRQAHLADKRKKRIRKTSRSQRKRNRS